MNLARTWSARRRRAWGRSDVKVLLVKTSSMGDVVHTAPAITEAALARPDVILDWVVEEGFSAIARLHPQVRTVHAVAMRRWRRRPVSARTWSEIRALRSALREERYDLVIDAQGLLKSLFIARLAGAPIHGFDRLGAREPAAALGYHQGHKAPRDRHAIERTRLLFAGALGYAATAEHPGYGLMPPRAPAFLRGQGDIAVLLHGTTWSSKQWPERYWAELAREMVELGYRPVLPWSDEGERLLAERVAAAAPPTSVLPRSSLGELAGLIAASRLVVGVDTGLMHLAAAFGVPTISLFASTSPDLTGPVGNASTVLRAAIACAPCRQRVCPRVPRGAEPPCHATLAPPRVLDEMGRRDLGPIGAGAVAVMKS